MSLKTSKQSSTTNAVSTTSTTATDPNAQYAAGQQFIQDAMINPSLAQSYAQEIMTVNNNNIGNSDAITAQLTSWLQQQGYNTTPDIVYQAFLFAQNNELAFWTGIYGITQVQDPNTLTLKISTQGAVTLNNNTLNNPTITPNSDNTLGVAWGFTNNVSAGSVTFSVGDKGNSFTGTIQLEVNGPALDLSGTSTSTASSNFSSLTGWHGNYNVSLSGFAPVFSVTSDSQGNNLLPYLGGTALSSYQFTPADPQANPTAPNLTWSNQNGTSGNIAFYFTSPFVEDDSTTPPTLNPSGDGGNWFYGTLTFPINGNNQTWTYWGLIGQPVSFPLSNWTGNYGATTLNQPPSTVFHQGPQLIIQADPNNQQAIQVLLDGTVINKWTYNCAYNLLNWTTANNATAGSITFGIESDSSNDSGLTFSGTLTQNGTTQNFSGNLSDPQQLGDWVGSYGLSVLTPPNGTDNDAIPGPALSVILTGKTPTVTLNFGNNQIATLPIANYDQQTATLSWSSSTGVSTSGSITFAQQTAPTSTSSYVGNYAYGSLTLPQAVGSLTAQTYTYQATIGQLSSGQTNTGPSSSSSSTSSNSSNKPSGTLHIVYYDFISFAKSLTSFHGILSDLEWAGKEALAFGKMIIMTIPAFFAFEILGKIFGEKPPKMDETNAPTVDQQLKDAPKTETAEGKQPSDVQQQQKESSDELKSSSKDVSPSSTTTSEPNKPTEPPTKPSSEPPTSPISNQKPNQPGEGSSTGPINVEPVNQPVSSGPNTNIPEKPPVDPKGDGGGGEGIETQPVEKPKSEFKPEIVE